MKFAYYSHHKCATGWTSSIVREICFYLGLRVKTVHGPQQYNETGSVQSWVSKHDVDFLLFTNAEQKEVQKLPKHKAFHVVRDPRDILVSAYFSHLNSHPTKDWPELKNHRNRLKTLSKEEGLLKEIDFSAPFLNAINSWDYRQRHILEIKMEDLTANPELEFLKILEHLKLFKEDSTGKWEKYLQNINRLFYKAHHELPFPFPVKLKIKKNIHSQILNMIIEKNRFSKKTGGRSKGEVDIKSHYRKGEPGDWKNHFTSRVNQKFIKKYSDLVEKLGYE